jgi:hypothetical protein
LTLKNTGDTMVCSHADWLKANACKWFLNYEGRVHNQAGIFFEDYVGIVMPRKENPTHHLDLSRYNYKYY